MKSPKRSPSIIRESTSKSPVLTRREEKSPDDFSYEGKSLADEKLQAHPDEPYVRVDNPDDFD